jgi:hypothetical protein
VRRRGSVTTNEQIQQLSTRVADALRYAGLPITTECESGADVLTDTSDDGAWRGVAVVWRSSQRLREKAGADLFEGRHASDAVALNGAVGDAMEAAIREVLRAQGYEVEGADDDAPGVVRVLGRADDVK